MSRKSWGKVKKIRDLTRYDGNVAIYELSEPLKVGRDSTDYLIIADYEPVLGERSVSMWFCDEIGVMSSIAPFIHGEASTVNSALQKLGYKLI